MARIYERYTEEMRGQFGYLASWLPTTPLRLGDIGLLARDRFQRMTSLDELGVGFRIGETGRPGDLEYTSAGQVEITWDARAQGGDLTGTVSGRGAVTVAFGRAHATLFQARDCRISAIADLQALEASVRGLAENGVWRREYVLVTELVETGPATVLVSGRDGARADFRVGADGAAAPMALAGGAGKVRLAAESGIGFKVVASTGLTPLFRACGLRARLRRPPRLVFRGDPNERKRPPSEDQAALSASGGLVQVDYE